MDHQTDGSARAREFIAHFNEIDDELRNRLGEHDRTVSFTEVSKRFIRTHRWWKPNHDRLRPFTQMRNFLVHVPRHQGTYLATPSPEAVEHLRRVRDNLLRPDPVMKDHAGDVVTMTPRSRLSEVLDVVARDGITHFPVYDDERLVGLVTSEGLAHWLAARASELALVDLDEATVADVLAVEDDPSRTVTCVAKTTPVADAFDAFLDAPRLQAVLITESGEETESPLGILTTWDAAQGVED